MAVYSEVSTSHRIPFNHHYYHHLYYSYCQTSTFFKHYNIFSTIKWAHACCKASQLSCVLQSMPLHKSVLPSFSSKISVAMSDLSLSQVKNNNYCRHQNSTVSVVCYPIFQLCFYIRPSTICFWNQHFFFSYPLPLPFPFHIQFTLLEVHQNAFQLPY